MISGTGRASLFSTPGDWDGEVSGFGSLGDGWKDGRRRSLGVFIAAGVPLSHVIDRHRTCLPPPLSGEGGAPTRDTDARLLNTHHIFRTWRHHIFKTCDILFETKMSTDHDLPTVTTQARAIAWGFIKCLIHLPSRGSICSLEMSILRTE